MSLKPPIPYFGSKMSMAAQIVAEFPPHEHYVEPFAGSLSVLLAKPRSRMETVNDLDQRLVTFWRVLRDRPEELERACLMTPHSRAEHEHSKRFEGVNTDIEVARRVWGTLVQSRSRTLKGHGWRWARLHGHSWPDQMGSYASRIPDDAARIAGVSLECRDALDVIADYGGEPSVLLYVDPPYPDTSRKGDVYRVEMDSPEQHEALLEALASVKASVVLSGYADPLYESALAGWRRVEMGGYTDARAERTEVIWCNREPSHQDPLDFGGAA